MLMLLRGLMRLALLALLAYLLYRFACYLLLALRQPDAEEQARRRSGAERMVLDPECGTHIPRGDALQADLDGKTHYFCSRECRDAFLRKPH